jgi:Fe-S cluster assembly iron-binding protein IscA
MHPALAFVNDRLGPPPRRFRRDEWPDLVIAMPAWANDDDINVVFRDQRVLYKEGEVVWGAIVQANMLLYRHGVANCPATVIYSRHPDIDDDPAVLRKIALRLGGLKVRGAEDADEDRYRVMLLDERQRAMRWRAPERCTDGLPVYSTTVMVCRRHIPGGILAGPYFPLLRHRDTVATLIVPFWFWPRGFRDAWAADAERAGRNDPWVTISDRAVDEVRKISRQQGMRGDEWLLRAFVEVRDEGLQRAVRLDINRDYDRERDRVFEANGIRIVMDRREMDELHGLEIDFVIDAGQAGFRLI